MKACKFKKQNNMETRLTNMRWKTVISKLVILFTIHRWRLWQILLSILFGECMCSFAFIFLILQLSLYNFTSFSTTGGPLKLFLPMWTHFKCREEERADIGRLNQSTVRLH